MNKLEKIKLILKRQNENDILDIIDDKDNVKDALINEILNIDFEKQNRLWGQRSSRNKIDENKIEPINSIDIKNINEENKKFYGKLGKDLIHRGKLAIVTLAGGQGTRLGYSGPKGTYILANNKSLFEILCDILKEANKKYDTIINWYIMTSYENNEDTIHFFEQNHYFDYPKENIIFFKQNQLPMNTLDGKLFLNEEGLIKFGADGHGGIFDAMNKNNIISDMNTKGIKWVFVTPVDNPLVELADEMFVGIAEKEGYGLLCKSVEKNIGQKSGVFCLIDNKVSVIEYTEISQELANKIDKNGKLFLNNAHINCNMFNIRTINNILNMNDIQYHVAKKKAKYMKKGGYIIIPQEPNAYKYEKFIFDYFPSIEKVGVYKVERNAEYEPIKDNALKAKIAYLKKKGID